MSNKVVESDGPLIKNLQQPSQVVTRISDQRPHEAVYKRSVELNTDVPAKNSDLCVMARGFRARKQFGLMGSRQHIRMLYLHQTPPSPPRHC